MATPLANRMAAAFTSSARVYRPRRSTPPPVISRPASSATTVTTSTVNVARTSAPSQYPPMMPPRLGAASSIRRAKPDSKSLAMLKPLKTPPKAEAWSNTKP